MRLYFRRDENGLMAHLAMFPFPCFRFRLSFSIGMGIGSWLLSWGRYGRQTLGATLGLGFGFFWFQQQRKRAIPRRKRETQGFIGPYSSSPGVFISTLRGGPTILHKVKSQEWKKCAGNRASILMENEKGCDLLNRMSVQKAIVVSKISPAPKIRQLFPALLVLYLLIFLLLR